MFAGENPNNGSFSRLVGQRIGAIWPSRAKDIGIGLTGPPFLRGIRTDDGVPGLAGLIVEETDRRQAVADPGNFGNFALRLSALGVSAIEFDPIGPGGRQRHGVLGIVRHESERPNDRQTPRHLVIGGKSEDIGAGDGVVGCRWIVVPDRDQLAPALFRAIGRLGRTAGSADDSESFAGVEGWGVGFRDS